MTVYLIVALIALALGLYLFFAKTSYGDKRFKDYRTKIAAVLGGIATVAAQIVQQLEFFPWREYLTNETALAASLGTLALVAVFTALGFTRH